MTTEVRTANLMVNKRVVVALLFIVVIGVIAGFLLPSLGGSDDSTFFIQAINGGGGVAHSTGDTGSYELISAQSEGRRAVEQLIINDGSLNLVVEDVDATIEEIRLYAESIDGWVVQSGTSTRIAQGIRSGNIFVRVPAEQFNTALETIKTMADSVTVASIVGQDVTQEYIDLNSQITNLQAAEQQLQQIMDNAEETADVLAVYSELVRIRGEIEVAQGRVNYLTEASAFSAIRVNLGTEPQAIQTAGDAWRPGDTIANAIDALTVLFRFVIDVLIYAIVIGIPFLILVLIPFYFLYRRSEGLFSRFGFKNADHSPDNKQSSEESEDHNE